MCDRQSTSTTSSMRKIRAHSPWSSPRSLLLPPRVAVNRPYPSGRHPIMPPPANTRKTSYRKLMQERTKAHLSDVVAEATVRSKPHANSGNGSGASSSKLVKLSPEGK